MFDDVGTPDGPQLLEVALADHGSAHLLDPAECGDQHGHQQRDDCDDDKKFDKGKTAAFGPARCGRFRRGKRWVERGVVQDHVEVIAETAVAQEQTFEWPHIEPTPQDASLLKRIATPRSPFCSSVVAWFTSPLIPTRYLWRPS